MSQVFENLIEEATQAGPRRYARWDAALFRKICQGPALKLWKSIQDQPRAAQVLAGYLELVREGLGAGYLLSEKGGAGQPEHPNFLAFCLVHLIPQALPSVAGDRQLPLLAQVWNLGEGLLREPAWVDRFVVCGTGELTRLEDVEAFLVRTLEPVLTPAPPPRWQGPLRLAVLDARLLHEDFLPGEMFLAAPAVVCIRDRRHPEVHLGVFLRPQGQSQFLGLTSPLEQYADGGELPPLSFEANRARIGPKAVELPFLRHRHRHVLARSGFLVVSGVDSQRLWIVESP